MQNKGFCINYYISYKLPLSHNHVEILPMRVHITPNVILCTVPSPENVKTFISASHTV